MTYAITLIKGESAKREKTRSFLEKLKDDNGFHKNNGVTIERVFLCFGWPDLVLLLRGENVELINHALINLRRDLEANGDNIETSTLICTTKGALEEKKKEWARK